MTFATYPSLRERGVLVTGGATGIGAALVEAFVQQGSRVAFVDIEDEAAPALVARLGDRAPPPRFHHCDLTEIDALRATIGRIREELGPLAVLVNNAANDERHDVDDVTVDYWDRSFAVNLRHQFFAAQAVRPHMRELGRGSIVNLSSISWMHGGSRVVAYASAKAAVVGLTTSLGNELGPDNIRVNAIAPGAVLTERQRRLWVDEAKRRDFLARQAIKRELLPDAIARAALFLAADDSDMITKQCLIVDAGLR